MGRRKRKSKSYDLSSPQTEDEGFESNGKVNGEQQSPQAASGEAKAPLAKDEDDLEGTTAEETKEKEKQEMTVRKENVEVQCRMRA